MRGKLDKIFELANDIVEMEKYIDKRMAENGGSNYNYNMDNYTKDDAILDALYYYERQTRKLYDSWKSRENKD